MKIKHVNGTYWNADNDCFGPVQAVTEYNFVEDMPASVDDNDGTRLEKVMYSEDCVNYFPVNDYDTDPLASAVE